MKKFVAVAVAVLFVGTLAAEETGFRLNRGKIENLNESTMKVKDSSDTSSYQATDGMKINLDGKSKLSDLRNGDEITLIYSRQGDKNLIREINNLPTAQGKLQSNEDGKLTLKTSDDKTLTIKTTDATKFSMNDKAARPADPKQGDTIMVAYTKSGETYTARFVSWQRK